MASWQGRRGEEQNVEVIGMIESEDQPLVSIIVPTYNYASLIDQTLHDLRNQTYSRWQCVIVDDGSTDDTAAIVAKHTGADSRFQYLRQENRRQAAARNTGLAHITGKYVQFQDADDLLEPQKLARQVAVLESRPDIDIVYSNVRYFDSRDPRALRRSNSGNDAWMPELSGAGDEILRALVNNNIMPVNAPLIRRETVAEIGLFDERLPPVEDWQYFIRCAAAGKTFLYDDADGVRPLVRTHPESASSDQRRMYHAEILMRETLRPYLKGTSAEQLNEDRLAEITGLLGVEEFAHGRRTIAARQFLKAMIMDRRPRCRAKWLACTLVTPFASQDRLRRFVSTPVSQSLALRMSA